MRFDCRVFRSDIENDKHYKATKYNSNFKQLVAEWQEVEHAANALLHSILYRGPSQSIVQRGDTVDVEDLMGRGLIKGFFHEAKILGNGELDKKLKVCAHRFSKGAREKIEKAGGECVELKPEQRRFEEGTASE